MLKILEYPFDANEIIKQKKRLKRFILNEKCSFSKELNIAILGGYTTNNIRLILELFLLNYEIKPSFYESEYNQFYREGMFYNLQLEEFKPDIIYICTSNRNIMQYPSIQDSPDEVNKLFIEEMNKYTELWKHIAETYRCIIIQNNFEFPFFRLMGNKDASDIHGRINYITRLNSGFYEYAQSHDNFYICDINYISADYGLSKWSDPYYWHMYKYAVAVPAIPYLSYNVANIIKSLYGKNKRVFNLDLDNTLWGGIVGDDGVENIEIGQETAVAQAYSEFQEYIKLHAQIGILLTINSKNDIKNAIVGLKRPDSILCPEDFVEIQANWNPKNLNLEQTSKNLKLCPDSFVFIDDNPVERDIIQKQFQNVATPQIDSVEHYIKIIDRSGFFEVTNLSDDDIKRTQMYHQNSKREKQKASYHNYKEYLKSLEMKGEINNFIPLYMSRIAQLTNKSNQFNLTTRRYSQSEIEEVARDTKRIALYGKLTDKFGDNGVVSIVIGRIDGENKNELHMELWLMSCRVLKRDMEYAMMDAIVKRAKEVGVKKIIGYYYPTSKNSVVKDFYSVQGFHLLSEDETGNTVWEYIIPDNYTNKQNVISVELLYG